MSEEQTTAGLLRTRPVTSQEEKKSAVAEDAQSYADDGVDMTLIRWMLSLSPEERLQALQNAVTSMMRLQDAKPLT